MRSPTVDLDALADKCQYVQWHTGGKRYFSTYCRIPGHDDAEPSMLVFEDGAYCLGCRKRISLGKLSRLVSGDTRKYAPIKQHSFVNWNQVEPEELVETAHHTLLNFPQQASYLKERKIDSRIKNNKLGWYRGLYVFPGYDERKNLLGVNVRAGPSIQKQTGQRYAKHPKSPHFLYCPDWALLRNSDYSFVVFGLIDALFLNTLGYPVVSPTQGQYDKSELFDNLRMRLIVVPDQWEEKLAAKLVSNLGWRGELCRLDYPYGLKDPADFAKTDTLTKNLIGQLNGKAKLERCQ